MFSFVPTAIEVIDFCLIFLNRCKGLIILETYTTMKGDELKLPDFLDVVKEVTADRSYSMYNLSRKISTELEKKSLSDSIPKAPREGDSEKNTAEKNTISPVTNGTEHT